MKDVSLTSQTDFNELVTELLARFVVAAGAEIDVCIDVCLRDIAQVIGVDYAYIVRISDDGRRWGITHEWSGSGISSHLADYQSVPMGTFDWLERKLISGEVFWLNVVDELPPEAAEVRVRLEAVGFKSTLQVPMRGPGGTVVGCIALSSIADEMKWVEADLGRLRLVGEVIANVTQRAKVEKELRESEARYRATFEQAPIGILKVTLDGRLLNANNYFCAMLGYPLEELIGRHYSELTHPDDVQATSVLYESLQHNHSSVQEHEKRCICKDGSTVWVNLTLSSLHGFENTPETIIAAIENVTARKQSEEAMHAALAEVQLLTQRLTAENVYFQEEITSSLGFDEIIGESPSIRSTLRQLEHVAVTDASVLLLGETGTGKELLARAIHEHSPRKERPLVKVNLAALSTSLIESELFGHVKGAFTGAIGDRVGRFQLADGGTLFLDEIGELSPELQTKLLRVLQEGEFEQIGSGKTVKVDVRIVAATNRDLRSAMENEKFRADLYYRLAVFPIDVPPLRFRREDIPLLAWHFISKKQGRLGKQIKSIPTDVMRSLVQYGWPGNIRELENVIERAMILTSGDTLMMSTDLQPESRKQIAPPASSHLEIDRAVIIATLDSCRWKIKGTGNAAEQLGLKPSTLRYRMKTLGIERPGR